MTDQIENILRELQNATSKLAVLCDLYQNDLDYFDENDRIKINEFNAVFQQKQEQINNKIDSFVRFIKKSFEPSKEQIAREMALQTFNQGTTDDAPLPDDEKERIINGLTDIFLFSLKSKQFKSIYNPDLQRVFPITYDFEYCRPYAIEFLGKKHNISTWHDALNTLAKVLYAKDENPLKSYIIHDYSRKPLFSLRREIYYSPLEIVPGVFAEGNLCSNNILMSCRKLLDIYEIDYNEVHIFLRKIAANNNVQNKLG